MVNTARRVDCGVPPLAPSDNLARAEGHPSPRVTPWAPPRCGASATGCGYFDNLTRKLPLQLAATFPKMDVGKNFKVCNPRKQSIVASVEKLSREWSMDRGLPPRLVPRTRHGRLTW